MARSPKSINAPSTVSTPISQSQQPSSSIPTRTRTRKLSPAVSTPTASAPPTPLILTPVDGPSSSKLPKPLVEPKTHALRSVLGEKERTPCPFPGQYGGKDKCGLTEEDEKDETLMATCAACAMLDNRALSADEIASFAIEEGWLRPPSAAVIPATIINNAIRAHQRRCQLATPPRPSVLAKHLLAGSVNESVLEPALHPEAFSGLARPKGTVWFLAQIGKTKWKNPFAGIEIPKAPPRKPGPPKKAPKEIRAKPAPTPSSGDDKEKKKGKSKVPTASASGGPVKIRLVLGGQSTNANNNEDDAGSEGGSSSAGSRNVSRQGSHAPIDIPTNSSIPNVPRRTASRRMRNLDSSDESDTSDSDMELDGVMDPSRLSKPIRPRKERPAPLPLVGNPSRSFIPPIVSRSLGSPYFDWKNLSPSPTFTTALLPQQPPTNSPFPSHSLDNTTWAVRQHPDRFASFEESSSSSDDEMRDPGDWGLASGILIRGADEGEDDVKPIWSAEDEEAKVKEATDALRVLFPMSTPDEDMQEDDEVVFNQLDNNRPTPSDTSSIAESATTATVMSRVGPLKSADVAASIALSTWAGNSSPAQSPNLKFYTNLVPDASPTQHLSKLHHSFEASDMEVDEEPWLNGELPVKAEDIFSDDGLNSTIGDVATTPEHDRQLHTAAWALEAAANTSFRIKEEPEDYTSPLTPEEDDVSATRNSRASSSDSHTPSSRYSELPPFEVDHERMFRPDLEEVLMGPESISMEELDGWLPGMAGRPEKTPQRGRHSKGRYQRDRRDSLRKSGTWGGIGVGVCGLGGAPAACSPFLKETKTAPTTPARQRSTRSGVRRRSSTRVHVDKRTGAESLPTPPADDLPEPHVTTDADENDLEIDAFGPADFEAAKAEAEEREEKHRRACRAKAERQKELLEAYRQKVREGQSTGRPTSDITPPDAWEGVSPWSEGNWGTASTESINITTPGVLSPMALHSMSYLTLDTPTCGVFSNSMDPKALLSPPLHPGHAHGSVGMLDEVMSQQEVESLMPLANGPPAPITKVKSPSPIVPTNTVSSPIPIAPAPASLAPPKQTHKAIPILPAPPPVTPSVDASSSSAIVDLPTSLPTEIAPVSAPTASSAPAAAAPLRAPTHRVKTPPNTSETPKSSVSPAATSTSSASSAPPATTGPVPNKSQGTITKPLCPGVDACVVDNIPVYAHVWEAKTGKQILLRRLDTDFVNATSLLNALGVPPAKHSDFLQAPSAWSASHHVMSAHCSNGAAHSPGVPGIWVQLAEARDFAKRLKLSEGNLLSSILREDLFQLFAVLASIKPDHQASESFGLPFVARRVNTISQTSSAHSSTSSLTTSSANSKSTPNLPSLSGSAPASNGAARFAPKNPLVRPAAQPQPDSCPQPKRRRATTCIVGELAPMAKISPATAIGTNGSTTNKKPPPRATRASIAGDTVKPKVAR